MSYCRFGWNGSDVYVYEGEGGIVCCGCRLGGFPSFGTEEGMIVHLGQHRRAGHFVPQYAIEGLWNAIPGATKAREPEPISMTISELQLNIVRMQIEAEELEKKRAAQEEEGRRKP